MTRLGEGGAASNTIPRRGNSYVLKKIWHDPVWSKVIAAAIMAALTAIAGLSWQSIGAFLLARSPVANWLLGLLVLIILCEGAILFAERTKNAKRVTTSATGQDEDKVQITFPRPGEILSDPKPLGSSVSYPVRGRLKFLPEGHEIWLLTADDRSTKFWPQSFEAVRFDERTGEWNGRIHVGRRRYGSLRWLHRRLHRISFATINSAAMRQKTFLP